HSLFHLGDRFARDGRGFVSAVTEDLINAPRLGPQLLGARTNGSERGFHAVVQDALAVDTPPPGVPTLRRDVVNDRRRVERPMEVIDVADLGRPRIGLPHTVRIGHGRAKLLPDGGRRLQHADRVADRLRHLGRTVQPHDAARRRQERRRLGEIRFRRREPRIPPTRDLARELEVLDLVFTDRNRVGVIQENVGGLQNRVVQDAGEDVLLPRGLVLVLRLPFELADRGDRVEYPRQLGMFRHRRLHEQDGGVRIDAGGEQADRQIPRPDTKIRRIIRNGDRVIVDDTEDRLVATLHLHPVPYGAEVIPDVELTGWLDPAEDPWYPAKVARSSTSRYGLPTAPPRLSGVGRPGWPRYSGNRKARRTTSAT